MIGKLTGTIDRIDGLHVIIDVGGVGYAVMCSANTLRKLNIGIPASLNIETHVREDAINLYGFADAIEQGWFNLLTTVQGVGAKVALCILSTIAPERLGYIIASQDKLALTEADGVGPKLALRLVTELKDKAGNLMTPTLVTHCDKSGSDVPFPASNVVHDALSVLINLGYRRAEVYAVVTEIVQQNATVTLNEVIRQSLGELSRKDNVA
jgi:Holliday junction DNA helicase RuvA